MKLALALVVTGCGISESDAIRELDAPELGISQLATTSNADLFELRGLDANGNQVALVRRRLGDIPDLHAAGSELTLAIADFQTRIVSRERRLTMLLPTGNREMQAFLAHHEVSSALAAANILVFEPPVETAYATAMACPAQYLLTTPVVDEACWTDGISGYFPNGPGWTEAKNAGRVITRQGPRTPCTSESGGACSGAACFYGPNGFARAQISTDDPRQHVVANSGYCALAFASSPFPSASGTFPAGQGCPGGDSGDGDWDY